MKGRPRCWQAIRAGKSTGWTLRASSTSAATRRSGFWGVVSHLPPQNNTRREGRGGGAAGAEGSDLPPLRTLTYDPKHPDEFFALYQSSPYCQEAQFDLLRTMVTAEKLGQGQTLDFVFLSLGSMALLGYETGSDSSLMGQMALELDRQIQST